MLACWLARAIKEKSLRLLFQNEKVNYLSKLALVAKQAGHYARTWIDHDENGLLRNVM